MAHTVRRDPEDNPSNASPTTASAR